MNPRRFQVRGKPNPELKAECIRLRMEERRSLREIHSMTGAAKGSLSRWLKPYPLTEDEKRARYPRGNIGCRKERGKESWLHQRWNPRNWSRLQKAKTAEAAVLFRLILNGFHPFGSVFDGDKTDWLVETPSGTKKIQVKWAAASKGLPVVKLLCGKGSSGQRKYTSEEFDFIVGYDYFTDSCYVWSWGEVSHLKTCVAVCPEAKERWDKL